MKNRKELKQYSGLLTLMLAEKAVKVHFDESLFLSNNNFAINIEEELFSESFESLDQLNNLNTALSLTEHLESSISNLKTIIDEDDYIERFTFSEYSIKEMIISLLGQKSLLLIHSEAANKALKFMESLYLYPENIKLNSNCDRLVIKTKLENKTIKMIFCVKSMRSGFKKL